MLPNQGPDFNALERGGMKVLEHRGGEAVKPQQCEQGCISRAARKCLATAEAPAGCSAGCSLLWELVQPQMLRGGSSQVLSEVCRLSVRGRTPACGAPTPSGGAQSGWKSSFKRLRFCCVMQQQNILQGDTSS